MGLIGDEEETEAKARVRTTRGTRGICASRPRERPSMPEISSRKQGFQATRYGEGVQTVQSKQGVGARGIQNDVWCSGKAR